jgi:putative hydrolase of the HAD superfamily
LKGGNHSIKAIIFDLGNVVVDFDHSRAAKKISRFCKKSPQEIYDFFFESALTILFEQGKITPQEFFAEVKETLGLELSYESFVPIWNEIFFLSEKNRRVYNLANILNKRYKTALLSNVNCLHFEYLKKNFPVFDVFHKVFASCELGAMKPDHYIYKKSLSELGVAPQEAFYTDDRTELIQSAQLLGIKACVFQGVDKLMKDLREAGIEVN